SAASRCSWSPGSSIRSGRSTRTSSPAGSSTRPTAGPRARSCSTSSSPCARTISTAGAPAEPASAAEDDDVARLRDVLRPAGHVLDALEGRDGEDRVPVALLELRDHAVDLVRVLADALLEELVPGRGLRRRVDPGELVRGRAEGPLCLAEVADDLG